MSVCVCVCVCVCMCVCVCVCVGAYGQALSFQTKEKANSAPFRRMMRSSSIQNWGTTHLKPRYGFMLSWQY